MSEEKLYTVEEMAEKLQLSTDSIQAMCRKDSIPNYHAEKFGSSWRIKAIEKETGVADEPEGLMMAVCKNAKWFHDNLHELPEWDEIIKMETKDAFNYLKKYGYPKNVTDEVRNKAAIFEQSIIERADALFSQYRSNLNLSKMMIEGYADAISSYLSKTSGNQTVVTPEMYWDIVMPKMLKSSYNAETKEWTMIKTPTYQEWINRKDA